MKTKPAAQKAPSSLIAPNETITITVPKDSVTKQYQVTLAQLAKNLALPGFRRGKVPAKIAEEKLDRAQLIERVLDTLLPAAYSQAIKAANKTPITRPEFRVVAAEQGKDWVIEAEFAELPTITLGKYQTHVKTGLKEAAKALAEQAKTAKKPAQDEKAPSTPTPDQEKELRLQHIFRELVTQLKPQVPELLLKHETQHEFEHLVGQLKQLNVTVDTYLARRQMNMEQLSQELAVSTLNRLQLDLILGAIAKEHKLAVTDADREAYFAQIPDKKQREQLKQDQHYLGHLETNLTRQKVVDYLLAL